MRDVESRDIINKPCDGTLSPHHKAILKRHFTSAGYIRMVGVVPKITPERGGGTVSLLSEEITKQPLIWVRCMRWVWVDRRITRRQGIGSCLPQIPGTSKLKITLDFCIRMVWASD